VLPDATRMHSAAWNEPIVSSEDDTTMETSRGSNRMRASVLIILAVLIAALLAFDAYEYDGQYRKATIEQIDHEVENLLGK
jgi:hypothetical protein